MSPVEIKTRKTRPHAVTGKTENRYLVYYRLGGRNFKNRYAGSFKTKREAQTRRDLIAGELAAGRDPSIVLAAIATPPPAPPTLEQRWNEYAAGRVDVGDKAQGQYRNARDRWLPLLGADRDPHSITDADVVAGIAALTGDTEKPLGAGTIGQYVSVLRQVLDYADVTPNPVNSPKVKLPRGTEEEVNPPTSKEWFAIRAQAKRRSLLPLRLIECCGFRISECVNLVYGDIDFAEGKIRVSRARTKTGAGQRWLPVPDELLDEIADLCPLEDRAVDRQVFPDLKHDAVRRDLAKACLDAGVAAHHPHDLRHRRISLWLRLGIDPVQVSRWAGHSRTSMSLDTYGHVVLDPRDDEWRDFWLSVYDAERAPRAAPVRHQEDE